MAVELRFGLLADFAANGAGNKLTIVHVFNRWNPQPEKIGQPIGAGVLVVYLDCSLADGATHSLTVRIVDEDEEELPTKIQVDDLPFSPAGPGLPLSVQLLINLAPIPMPNYGDYKFELVVDSAVVGRVTFYVLKPVQSQPAGK